MAPGRAKTMTSDFDQVRQMLEIMKEHDLEEFELEREGVRVRLRKRSDAGEVRRAPAPSPSGTLAASMAAPVSTGGEETADDGLVLVKSPIVGTFYRAPEPEAEPFVQVGTVVKRGQVLCIIEAMKLMNEIDAEQDGEVVSVFVDSGQPVQYGEKLFAIRPV